LLYKWSKSSEDKLFTCDGDLIRFANEILLTVDCKVTYGYRGEEEQEKAFLNGKSKVRWPNSKHNLYPSRAIDIAPVPIDWSDIRRFYYFGGYAVRVAYNLGINIRWGGDWDGDFQVKDQNFNDLVHFELKD
jgi:peptidoglycan L-alanyl-D-glutamate endopeptidase CwlK